MSNGSLTVLGLGELQADFKRLAKSVGNKIARDAVMAGARVARDKARSTAPVRTGKLKKNIIAVSVKQADTPGGATAGIRVKNPTGKQSKALKRPGKKGAPRKRIMNHRSTGSSWSWAHRRCRPIHLFDHLGTAACLRSKRPLPTSWPKASTTPSPGNPND